MAIFVPSDLKWYIQGKKERTNLLCFFVKPTKQSYIVILKQQKLDFLHTHVLIHVGLLRASNFVAISTLKKKKTFVVWLSRLVRWFAANQQPGPMCTTACTYVGPESRFAKRFFITLLFLSTTQVFIFIDTNMIEKHGGIFELRRIPTQVWASDFSLQSP